MCFAAINILLILLVIVTTLLGEKLQCGRIINQLLNSVITKYRHLLIADQLLASNFGFGNKLIWSPPTNHDISLNLVQ